MLRGHPGFTGIIGWPLDYTLSPAIHNIAFRRVGLDWVYLPFPVPPERLAGAITGLRALGCMGANITMPHKGAVVEHLDGISGDAEAVGAVNTIQRVGDKLIGHNTDVDGFRSFLTDDAGLSVQGVSVVVLGAGGAARAVVKALNDLGAGDITIVARRPETGSTLVELAPRTRAHVEPWERLEDLVESAGMVVNATPVGRAGEKILSEAAWHPGQYAVDLLYEPPVTPLIAAARAGGAEAWGGLGMLIHQAAASFRIWTGQDPPLESMSAAALRALGARTTAARSEP